MRSDFGFGENDVNNIDSIIDALRELVRLLDVYLSVGRKTI